MQLSGVRPFVTVVATLTTTFLEMIIVFKIGNVK